jgi:hypothetical protein
MLDWISLLLAYLALLLRIIMIRSRFPERPRGAEKKKRVVLDSNTPVMAKVGNEPGVRELSA